MSKVQVSKGQIESYSRVTSALDEKYGHDSWHWAQWAFNHTEHGPVLGSPVAWQEVVVMVDGVWKGMAAVDAISQ